MATIDAIKARLDLVTVISEDLGQAQRSGAWLKWRCPFHDDRRPSLAVGPERAYFKCFGCGAHGDVLDWLQRRERLTFPEAKARAAALAGLDAGGSSPVRAVRREPVSSGKVEDPEAPARAWQDRAWEFVAKAQARLWDSDEGQRVALAYLRSRGLQDATISKAGLGWCPVGARMRPETWGLDSVEHRMIYLCRGIVIPLIARDAVWGVKIRWFAGDVPRTEGGQKYRHIAGGGDVWPYNYDLCRGDELLICEGEFDAMLALQELGGLVDVAAFKAVKVYFRAWLLEFRVILAAFDRDQAGGRFGASLAGDVPGVCLVSVPVDQDAADVTKFHQRGGDLRAWLRFHRERCRKGVA